ncbi:MAG: helix-turn-helix domain-containing protein [Sulfolobaceae archaeon]
MKYVIEIVAKKIIGDIVWSEKPGVEMKKWREIFKVSQNEVAKVMGISSSVIADYERGKRTPGSLFVKKFVNALIDIDSRRDYAIVKELAKAYTLNLPYIEDMSDFERPVNAYEIVKAVDGIIPTSNFDPNLKVYGYILVDSIKTITTLSGLEFYQFLSFSLGRAVILTEVNTGRSPMIALKIAPLKPSLVVLHKPLRMDPLALYLAEREQINLVIAFKGEKEIINSLKFIAVQ